MLFSSLLPLLAIPLSLLPSTWANSSTSHWSTLASRAKDGIIKLDSESYDALLASDREYSVSVVLTALPSQFKCQPCHDFDPAWHQVAGSWKRQPQYTRDQHFFAQLDFADGQAVYQRLGLSSAPTVQFHPAMAGPNKGNKISVITYDMNRQGLASPALHSWLSPLTPTNFKLHTPFNPIPFIVIPFTLLFGSATIYTLYPYLLPLFQSRITWGVTTILMILVFTSGYMWNKIKNAPYVNVDRDGKVNWIAGGFQNQLGLESQVVAGIYGVLAFSIVALTVLVPAQSSAQKQRFGVYLWLGMLVIVFSILMKLFKVKNPGYPYALLL